MTKLLLPFILLAGLTSNAQIINFPDPDFKNVLVNYPSFVTGAAPIDTNGDGEIQVTEAYNYGFTLGTGSLVISGHSNITDLTGINNFTTISSLYCTGNNLSSLDVSALNVTQLNCSNNPNLSSITWPNPGYLTYVTCGGCNLGAVNISGYNMLEDFYCLNSGVTSIDVSGCSALTLLQLNSNQLTTLDVTGLPLLQYVNADDNLLTSINIGNFSGDLYINQNRFTTLNLGGTNIFRLECRQNLFTTLDLSSFPNLAVLNCDYNQQLTNLNIKNGSGIYLDAGASTLTFCPNLHYVCADQFEVFALQNYFVQHSMPNVNVNSQCVFLPGGNSIYSVSGTIRMDNDNNGCTVSDPPAAYTRVKIYNAAQQIEEYASYPSGSYWFYTFAGDFDITPQIDSNYFNVSPTPGITVSVGPGNPNQVTDFCVSANGIHSDLEIVLIPISQARPGFNALYQLVYKNKGNQPLSGNVQLDFNDNRLNFVFADPAVSIQSVGSLSWVYANLLPLETRTINLTLSILPPPVNNIGDSLTFYGTGNPVINDETNYDNYFKVDQILTGAFDPNDKTCLEGKYIDVTHIGEYLHYVIRFQNTGNDTAFNVVVGDMLSTNYDWNSFEIVKTSHPFLFKQTLGNKIEFFFPNIKLPAQAVNDAGSSGFVAFKIKPVNTIGFQDSLVNNASIFFDFNLPVVTNNAISIIDSAGLIPVSMEYFKGSRQNDKHYLAWKANCSSSHILFSIERSTDNRIFKAIGNITASSIRCLNPFDFSDNDPLPGINYYRIKMTDADGKTSYSMIVALLNKKNGLEIVGLLPNPVINRNAWLNITSAQQQRINIKVSDASGRINQATSSTVIAGTSQVDMNFGNFAPGVYTIIVSTEEGEEKIIRFVKK